MAQTSEGINGVCKLARFYTEFHHRVNLRGGGVGAYINNGKKYKRRHDIERIHQDLEHLRLEIPGRNRRSK